MNSLCSCLRLSPSTSAVTPSALTYSLQPLSPFRLLFHHLCTFLSISLQIDYNFFHLKNDSAFIHYAPCLHRGWLSGGAGGKAPACQCKRLKFNPWVRKSSCRRKWWPTPVLLPGESHGWRSLVGCSPWGWKKSDMTEWLSIHVQLLYSTGNLTQCSVMTYVEKKS